MLLIAVCDDIPIECADIARRIADILERTSDDFVIKRYFNGQELLESKESFDIIFLDIKMPVINGMDLAKNIRNRERDCIIIFITSAKEYVYEAYDVEAFQYLLKPVRTDRLKYVLERAVKKVKGTTGNDSLIIFSERQTKKIRLKDICYIESMGRIARIHCKNGVVETYEKIGVLDDKLSGRFFFRCHKCFIVNLDCVDTFNKSEVLLDNGDKIILAKRRQEEFRKAFLSYMKTKGGIL